MLYPDFNELLSLRSKAASLDVSSNRAVSSAVSGDYKSPFRGQGLEFEEVRKYVAGDDVRNIDWRVTARTGSPHMKVFTEERERTVVICVDVNYYMRFGTRGTFKSIQAARAAALLGWRSNANNDRVGTCLYGDVKGGMQFFSPNRSRKSLWKMFKQLSDTNPVTNKIVPLDDMLLHLNKAAPTGALIFIISDFQNLTQATEKHLGSLHKRSDIILIDISDPADSNIIPVGTVLFSNDNNEFYVNTDSKTGRDTYRKAAQNNHKKLEKLANKLRLSVIHLATNRDVFSDLRQGLNYISKRRGRK